MLSVNSKYICRQSTLRSLSISIYRHVRIPRDDENKFHNGGTVIKRMKHLRTLIIKTLPYSKVYIYRIHFILHLNLISSSSLTEIKSRSGVPIVNLFVITFGLGSSGGVDKDSFSLFQMEVQIECTPSQCLRGR